jgi:hypothetical protein
MSKNFIISQEIADEVIKSYKWFIDSIDQQCGESECACDVDGPKCSQWIKDELNLLVKSLRAIRVAGDELKKDMVKDE